MGNTKVVIAVVIAGSLSYFQWHGINTHVTSELLIYLIVSCQSTKAKGSAMQPGKFQKGVQHWKYTCFFLLFGELNLRFFFSKAKNFNPMYMGTFSKFRIQHTVLRYIVNINVNVEMLGREKISFTSYGQVQLGNTHVSISTPQHFQDMPMLRLLKIGHLYMIYCICQTKELITHRNWW